MFGTGPVTCGGSAAWSLNCKSGVLPARYDPRHGAPRTRQPRTCRPGRDRAGGQGRRPRRRGDRHGLSRSDRLVVHVKMLRLELLKRVPGCMSLPPDRVFVVARNPRPTQGCPPALTPPLTPLDPGLVLRPATLGHAPTVSTATPSNRGWPDDAQIVDQIVEETRASSIGRRGAVIDLVLDRPRPARSQFVFHGDPRASGNSHPESCVHGQPVYSSSSERAAAPPDGAGLP
jgi:hypothetical protein